MGHCSEEWDSNQLTWGITAWMKSELDTQTMGAIHKEKTLFHRKVPHPHLGS